MAEILKDMNGVELSLGDTVIKPYLRNECAYLEECRVTKIDGHKVYFDHGSRPTRMPITRMRIITKEMVKA